MWLKTIKKKSGFENDQKTKPRDSQNRKSYSAIRKNNIDDCTVNKVRGPRSTMALETK